MFGADKCGAEPANARGAQHDTLSPGKDFKSLRYLRQRAGSKNAGFARSLTQNQRKTRVVA
jgi:hypothetical protein